jgi:putative spermidine/putrescine transport system substrate-binding protein
MRVFAAACSALAATWFAAAIAIAQADKPVSVYWSAGQIGKNLKEAFVDTYPDKQLIRILEGGDNPRFTQMQANRSAPNFDIGTFIDVLLPLVIRSGLIMKIEESRVPNVAEIEPALRGWNDFAVSYSYGSWGILYNPETVKRPITTWSDLLREDLKGHVTAPNITYNSSIYTLDGLARMKGGSLKEPDAGLQAMREIRLSGPGLWDQESIAIGWLKTGEAWATPIFSGSALRLISEKDTAHLKFVAPADAAYLVATNFVRLTNSPNPSGADRFLNYMLSRDAQARWPSIGKSRPANRYAAVPPDVEASVPPAAKMLKIDADYFVANRTAIVQKWNEVVNR